VLGLYGVKSTSILYGIINVGVGIPTMVLFAAIVWQVSGWIWEEGGDGWVSGWVGGGVGRRCCNQIILNSASHASCQFQLQLLLQQ
jgi:hypothetical protein